MFLETTHGFINVNRIVRIEDTLSEDSMVEIVYEDTEMVHAITWASEHAVNHVLEQTNTHGRVSPF